MGATRRAIKLMMLLALLLTGPAAVRALTESAADDAGKPFVVEYYYKAKWGYADEFIQLFKKNPYPVLKKEKELGRILQVSAVAPKYHTTEDGRWDLPGDRLEERRDSPRRIRLPGHHQVVSRPGHLERGAAPL